MSKFAALWLKLKSNFGTQNEAITTSVDVARKGYGSYAGQGRGFVWVAYRDGKRYKTSGMSATTISDARTIITRMVSDLGQHINKVEIIGRDSKVLATLLFNPKTGEPADTEK